MAKKEHGRRNTPDSLPPVAPSQRASRKQRFADYMALGLAFLKEVAAFLLVMLFGILFVLVLILLVR